VHSPEEFKRLALSLVVYKQAKNQSDKKLNAKIN